MPTDPIPEMDLYVWGRPCLITRRSVSVSADGISQRFAIYDHGTHTWPAGIHGEFPTLESLLMALLRNRIDFSFHGVK